MSRTSTHTSPETKAARPAWQSWSSPLALGMCSSLLLWLALPPVDLWPLGWVAPIPWLLLIRRKNLQTVQAEAVRSTKNKPLPNTPAQDQPGRFRRLVRWPIRVVWRLKPAFDFSRPYVAIWWAGFAFWLGAVHWLRYPHPLTHFGWLALAFYLAFYLPAFIAISRVAVHRLQVPLTLAAPIVWTGLELARAYLLTGFLMGALAHTQCRWIELIQISDIGGAYAVSLLIMFVASCLARILACDEQRMAIWPILPLSLSLLGTLIYGYQRTADPPRRAGPSVALIQGAIAPDWKMDPDRNKIIHRHYFELTDKALKEKSTDRPIDLIVWPETMYRNPLLIIAPDFAESEERRTFIEERNAPVTLDLAAIAERLQSPLLFGIDAFEFTDRTYVLHNSAVFVSRQGELLGRYDKMHRVMFGEYIPFADSIPFLYQLTPLTGGISPGLKPLSVEVNGVKYSPNICYETVIPHVIRRQVLAAQAEGKEPDVLINLTNDAWFRGSSELDMHLACGVFRAIECRKPLLIAANEGISASIDSDGRIVHQLPKRSPGYLLLTDIQLDDRHSLYLRFGDWVAGICLAMTVIAALIGIIQTMRRPKS
jgi:apolipoprotein N-acyltransferase